MILSQKCDTASNYIGQIEMGRRIPSFDKIEKIAAALDIFPHELFICENKETYKKAAPKIKDYLAKMPANVKKELISSMVTVFKKNIEVSFDSQNFKS